MTKYGCWRPPPSLVALDEVGGRLNAIAFKLPFL